MPDDSRILRIGEWRVDPDLDELSREGQTIRLEPRPMRLLLYLAAHAGRVVDVPQLLDEVWPNVIVTHGSVYQAIAQLRRILGDESEHPKYIENLPRRGYRLIAPVTRWDVPLAAATDSSSAARGFPQVTNGSVAAEPQLTSGAPEAAATPVSPGSTTGQTPRVSRGPPRWSKAAFAAIGVVLAAVLAYVAIEKFWISNLLQIPPLGAPATEKASSSRSVAVEPVGSTFNPPPHSIAVLPFVNMSGDASQDYFSDGLSEELINALSRINELQVAARTSSFYFKGEHADLATIARKLNVATVLEGSVRRSGHAVRITAQLNNAVTGFHLWSQTYDRDLGDVLKLQTEIATALASALRVTLLGDEAARIELGGTRNPAAFDAYLGGSKAFNNAHEPKHYRAAIAAYTEAIGLDPHYALAFAGRSTAYSAYAREWTTGTAIREGFAKAQADARQAITLAPELAEGHLALAVFFGAGSLDFTQASKAYERALSLSPGNAGVLNSYGRFAVSMGHTEAGIAAARRAVALDPLNSTIREQSGEVLQAARRYREAVAAYQETLALEPDAEKAHAFLGLSYYLLGDLLRAQSSCEINSSLHGWIEMCLAVTYDKLGRRSDAEAAVATFRASWGDAAAYNYAQIYAQWGNSAKAFAWLETALRLRDPGLYRVKTDPLLDPLRKEPRLQAIERELKFPE